MPKVRVKSNKSIRNALHIFCEGKNTEPNYIKGYMDSFPSSRRKFIINIAECSKNTPKQLVDEAICLRKSDKFHAGDIIWVAYDRESPSKYKTSLHAESYQKAMENKIKIAISNVCFEFWILLHLKYTTSTYSSFDDLCNNSDLTGLYKQISGKSYKKSDIEIFKYLKNSVETAKKNAERVRTYIKSSNEHGAKPYDLNPYTNFDELLNDIDMEIPNDS